jgi:hypothetical protein
MKATTQKLSPIEIAFCQAVSILVKEDGMEVNEAKKLVKGFMNLTADILTDKRLY